MNEVNDVAANAADRETNIRVVLATTGAYMQFDAADVSTYVDGRPTHRSVLWVRIKSAHGALYKLAAKKIEILQDVDIPVRRIIFDTSYNLPFKCVSAVIYGLRLPQFPVPKNSVIGTDGLSEKLAIIDKDLRDHELRISELKKMLDDMGVRLRAIDDKLSEQKLSGGQALNFLIGDGQDPYLVMARNAIENEHRQRAMLLRDATMIVEYERAGGLSPAAHRVNDYNRSMYGQQWEDSLNYVRQLPKVST